MKCQIDEMLLKGWKVTAQNIESNQSLIFVYVSKRSKLLVILFLLTAVWGLK